MLNKKLSRGTYGVLLTPLTEERELDMALLEKELSFCVESEITGVLTLGSTGEFPYLNLDQRKTVLRLTKEILKTKRELIAGVSGYTEREVTENIQICHELGYTNAIICPPYYYPQSQNEVLQFFKTISSSSPKDMNLILYNIPFCTAGISLQTLDELCRYENIIGLKDSSGDGLYMAKALQIVNKYRNDFSYFTGQDALLLPSLTLGGSGCMSALSWILHEEIKKIIIMFDNDHIQNAQELQSKVNDLVMHLDGIPFPENYRALASVTSVDCGVFQRYYNALAHENLKKWKKEADIRIKNIQQGF